MKRWIVLSYQRQWKHYSGELDTSEVTAAPNGIVPEPSGLALALLGGLLAIRRRRA